MTDYSQGKIYAIVSNQTNDIYIGSTKDTLEDRMVSHKSKYKKWLIDKSLSYRLSFELLKYNDYEIKKLEDYPCETEQELRKREGYYQLNTINCINKKIAGRTPDEWYEENKEKILQYHKEYYEENKEKILVKNKEYRNRPEIKERKKEYHKEWYEKNKEVLSQKAKERYQKNKHKLYNRSKIKCVCGSEHRKADTRRHQRSQKHIKYIEEMKEKADATNLNEFFEQFRFKIATK